jgi:hypothetical protein
LGEGGEINGMDKFDPLSIIQMPKSRDSRTREHHYRQRGSFRFGRVFCSQKDVLKYPKKQA